MSEINGNELLLGLLEYRNEKIKAHFQIEDSRFGSQRTTGYVRGFDLNAHDSYRPHVELSNSLDNSEDSHIVYFSEVLSVKPVDLEKARSSLLERNSQKDTERILKAISLSVY